MSSCPICQCPLTGEEAEWSDGNHRVHMVCADSLVMAVLDASLSKNRYARTIVQTLFQSARQVLVREGAIT